MKERIDKDLSQVQSSDMNPVLSMVYEYLAKRPNIKAKVKIGEKLDLPNLAANAGAEDTP